MKFLGIDFVPLDEPLHRRLETLATGAWFITSTFLGFLTWILCIYLLFTPLWWVIVIYLCWMYIDRNSCEIGGRPSEWVRNWTWWRLMKSYFPAKLLLVPGFSLEPKKNYIFCCFPHGVLPAGPFNNIASAASEFHKLFPNFQVKTTALNLLYRCPLTREIGLGLGGVSCSAKSLNYFLTKPEGGYILNLFPGGAAEAAYAFPGTYKFIVKNRKGFVRIALQNGAPLVPVITFGETDLFDQIQGPIIRKFQKCFKKLTSFLFVLFIGRGFLQNNFGAIPRRKPITTVVGPPIDVKKIENPTTDQIEEVHEIFVQELVNLFEKYKHQFVENPENTKLELK